MTSLALYGGTPVRSKPFPKWPVYDDAERTAIQGALESGMWAYDVYKNSFGPQTVKFAEAFASHHTAKYAYLVSNGSVALEIALLAAEIGPGDEVIVPPLTFIATATAVVRVGATPIFADVDSETFCLDPDAVTAAITPRTRAVIPVHLGCCLADMDAFPDLGAQHNLVIIEDCAHVPGALWRNRGVGSFGTYGCFSFQATKPLTSGEGGAIIISDDHLQEVCFSLINCGRTRGGDSVTDAPLGWNARITELQAAVLLSQFDKLESQIRTKETNTQLLVKGLSDLRWIEPVRLDDRVTKRQYYYLTLRYHEESFDRIPRDVFIDALQAEGIPTHFGYTPVYQDPLFVDVLTRQIRQNPHQRDMHSYLETECPIAEKVAMSEVVNIPHHILLGSEKEVQDVLEAIHKIDRCSEELAKSQGTIRRANA